MEFFNRKYELIIGDYKSGNGLKIDNLQITFSAEKSANNKEKIDKCTITVYNLSEESLTYLETDYRAAVFSCGYEGLVNRLFFGEITKVETTKKGVDRLTKLSISPNYSEMTHKLMAELVPENGTVEDAIEVVRKQTSLAKGVYRGAALSEKIIYGYPLNGTPKQMIDQICNVYKLQWRIEGEALTVLGEESVESEVKELAPVISVKTGLIDKPYYTTGDDKKSTKDSDKKRGVKFTALLNPNVVAGSLVRVDYGDKSNYYKVEEVLFKGDFRGDSWFMTCLCSERPNK